MQSSGLSVTKTAYAPSRLASSELGYRVSNLRLQFWREGRVAAFDAAPGAGGWGDREGIDG